MIMRPKIVSALVGVVMAACGNGNIRHAKDVQTVVSGRVARGIGTRVAVYEASPLLEKGEELATVTANDGGEFRVVLTGWLPTLIIAAHSGSYSEDAFGVVDAPEAELLYLLPSRAPGDSVENILISPISHWATALAHRYVRGEGQAITDALAEAWGHLNAHFDGPDWRYGAPTDLSAVQARFDEEAGRGAILAGISMLGRNVAAENGLPLGGAQAGSLAVASAVYDDVEHDGYFDGIAAGGQLLAFPRANATAPSKLGGHTIRRWLALSIARFLRSERNVSGVPAEAASLLGARMSSNRNRRIFRPEQSDEDDEPPIVSFASSPASATREEFIDLLIAATDGDGTGVAQVFAEVGNHIIDGDRKDGLWRFRLPLELGKNEFEVWAEDWADPVNSGFGQGRPHHLHRGVVRDVDGSMLSWSPVPSYVSELGIAVEKNHLGEPTMPIRYVLKNKNREVLDDGGSVYKSVTRLSWGSRQPTIHELETNVHNVPFVRVAARSTRDELAADSIEYRIRLSCEGCPALADATGKMLVRDGSWGEERYFFLPLALETIPDLRRATSSPVTLSIAVVAKDFAGNKSALDRDLVIFYHLVGAPLAIWQDWGYGSTGDPGSKFPYYSKQTYTTLWTQPSLFPDGVRVASYTLRNPHPIDVAVRIAGNPMAIWVESWDQRPIAEVDPFFVDGATFDDTYLWKVSGAKGGSVANHPCRYHEPHLPPGEFYFAAHTVGSSSTWECHRSPYPVERGAGGTTVQMPLLATRIAVDGVQPQSLPGPAGLSYLLLPASTGGKPKAMTLFLARAFRSEPRVLRAHEQIGLTSVPQRYAITSQYFWQQFGKSIPCEIGGLLGTPQATCGFFGAIRLERMLTYAGEWCTGDMEVRTSALSLNRTPYGDDNVNVTGVGCMISSWEQ